MPTSRRSSRSASALQTKRRRAGFTLAEILLVLAILVIIAAIAVPTIKGPLDNYRLRKSADTIRAAFASARNAAARTGMTHIFEYKPESGEYQIKPWTTGDEFLEVSGAPTINTGGTALPAAPSLASIKTTPLPQGILFHAAVTDSSVRDMRTLSNTGNTIAAMSSAPTAAPPILFYSDGSSSNATIVLKNDRGSYIQIKLRGLTGHSTASNLLSASQLSSQPAGS